MSIYVYINVYISIQFNYGGIQKIRPLILRHISLRSRKLLCHLHAETTMITLKTIPPILTYLLR